MTRPGKSDTFFPGLYLQPRDLQLLAELGEFGLLSTEVIHRRHFPKDTTGVAVRRRLRMLAGHGLIQSVTVAVARQAAAGRLPAFHRLTPHGAEVLQHEIGMQAMRPGRSELPKPHTILHRAGMAEVALTFTDACRLHGLTLPTWHFEFDSAADVSRNAPLSQRFLLRNDYRRSDSKMLICWPDALCRFELTQQERSWKLALAWEYDRSSETHRQIAEKLDAYLPWLHDRAYFRNVPDAADVRVFFVVPSRERLTNLVSSFHAHACAAVVRIAVARDLFAQEMLTTALWQPLDGSPPRPIVAK